MQISSINFEESKYKNYFNELDINSLTTIKFHHHHTILLKISKNFNENFLLLNREEQTDLLFDLLFDLGIKTSKKYISKFISSYHISKKIDLINKGVELKAQISFEVELKKEKNNKLKEINLETFHTDKKEDIIVFILSFFIMFYLFQIESINDIIGAFLLILLSLYIYFLKYENVAEKELKGFNNFFVFIKNLIEKPINFFIKKINKIKQ